jgi:2,2-dialkylglycine decarboxylase (pyruvate)
LPLSAVITSTEIEEVCAARDYSFYTTHVSDPLVASVGLEVIRIVERDNLAQRAAILGERFRGGLRELQKRFPCIGCVCSPALPSLIALCSDVRGIGLMIGLEIVKDPVSKEADEARGSEMARILFDLGLSANVTAKKGTQSCFRIAPPLNSTEAQIDEALRMFEQALELTEK